MASVRAWRRPGSAPGGADLWFGDKKKKGGDTDGSRTIKHLLTSFSTLLLNEGLDNNRARRLKVYRCSRKNAKNSKLKKRRKGNRRKNLKRL